VLGTGFPFSARAANKISQRVSAIGQAMTRMNPDGTRRRRTMDF
jgi:hypothetical protein